MHRDVKPSNVLLDQQGDRDHAYLADFGLTHSPPTARPRRRAASWARSTTSRPSRSAATSVDGRADQYALGCLLFECLTGLAARSATRSEVATIFAHLEEPPPAASERHDALPPAVDAVLARAMAKDPRSASTAAATLVAATHDALGLSPPTPRRGALARAGARARGRRARASPPSRSA